MSEHEDSAIQNIEGDPMDLFIPDQVTASPHRFRPIPGLPESVLWIAFFIILQLVWTVVLLMAVSSTGAPIGEALELDLASLSTNGRLLVMTAPSFLAFLVLIPLAWRRLRCDGHPILTFQRTSWQQWAISLSLIVPLMIVADTSFRVVESLFEQFLPAGWEATDVHGLLRDVNDASLPLSLFFIAVVPAIGEEFLFRGMIGRGLTSRWGVIPGVILTSILFAAVHLYPPHVVAILPVGIALHLVYLATRNFWVPVVFHLINNSIAAVLIRQTAEESTNSVLLSGFCLFYVLIGLFWLMAGKFHGRGLDCDDSPGANDVHEGLLASAPLSQSATVTPIATGCAIVMLILSAAVLAR